MSEIGNVSNPNLGMANTGRVNNGSLPVPAKANTPNPVAAETYDDAAVLDKEPLHSQYADNRRDWDLIVDTLPVIKKLGEAVSEINDKLLQAKDLATEIDSNEYTSKEAELRKEQVEELLKEINSIAESVNYDGNKLLTAEGKDVSIPVGDDEVLNIEHLDLTFGVEQISWASAGNVLDTIVREIELIKNREGFLLGIDERVEDAATLMKYEQGLIIGEGELAIDQIDDLAVNKVRGKMKDYSANTLNQFEITDFVKNELNKFSENSDQKTEEKAEEPILNIQANVEPERVLKLVQDLEADEG